jgi:hypothetical protein
MLVCRRRWPEWRVLLAAAVLPLVSCGNLKPAVQICVTEKSDSPSEDSNSLIADPSEHAEVAHRLTNAQISTAQDSASNGSVGLLVRLTFEDESSRSAVCTGVVAARNLLLTAAHCFTDMRRGKVIEAGGWVFTGPQIDFRNPSAGLAIRQVALHPQWNGWFHDLALVTVAQDFPDSIAVPAYVRDVNDALNGQAVSLFGYGISGDGRSDSGTLRKAESAVFNLIQTQNYPKTVLENQVRIKGAAAPVSQACTGDSGGPAYLKSGGALLALVSGMNITIQQNLSCSAGDANYTLLSPYSGWIETVAGVSLNTSAQAAVAKDMPRAAIAEKDANATGFVVRPTQAMIDQGRNQQTTSFETSSIESKTCE